MLSRPSVYELWSRFVGGPRARRTLVNEYIRPAIGARILDLGCGPGEILDYLPRSVDYLGIDVSQAYITYAQKRFAGRGEFRVGDATTDGGDTHSFDLVIALGVLHHLDDPQARSLFRCAANALKLGGRVVTVDATFAQGQNRMARVIIENDRGQHVRTPDEYPALATPYLASVRSLVRNDLLRIPYSHCIVEATMLSVVGSSADAQAQTTKVRSPGKAKFAGPD